MDLNFTAEELAFRDELRAWLAANVPKDWNEWREKPMEESFPYLRAWQRKLHEGRWAAVSWPKEYGGRSATLMQQAIFWEEMARVEAPPMANSLGSGTHRPHDHCLRHRSAKEAVHSENSERGRNLVPGLLRAQRRLRSCRSANRSASGRRSLHRQRPESVDQLRLGWRLVRTRGAHRPECAQTQRSHGPARGHEVARRGSSSAAPDDRRIRIQRVVFSRCARAG